MLAGPREERFESLDILRGLAVLGIFAVNIIAFAQPFYVFANPSLLPDLFDASGGWWAVSHTFFNFKFITIFSVLFGAGVLLMVGEEKPSPRFGIHMRRMLWLLLFGVIHNYAIWYGDILAPYAIAGFIVVLFRRRSPLVLFIIAGIFLALNYLLMASQGFWIASMSPQELAEITSKMWAPPPDVVQGRIDAWGGAWPGRMANTWPDSLQVQLVQTFLLMLRTLGLMMIGMALYKSGFFTLRWSTIVYGVLAIIGIAVGVYFSHTATEAAIASGFDFAETAGTQLTLYWASLVQSFGYASLVMLIAKLAPNAFFTAPFAAAGRMALTNYLACSLIGAFVFYGPPGLGLIGTWGYDKMALMTLVVWIAILVWSPIWLSVFRFGPFEWLWRSLTYGRLQQLRK